MKKVIFISIFTVFFVSTAIANTGYFAGSGQTITLTKTKDIQLVEEEVTIRPKCGWEWLSDSVDYRCKLVLKNLSKKPVKAQVGFPLDSQFMQGAKESDTTKLVLDYHFLVRDESNTYHVRYVPSDSEHKFSRLFLWDMDFKPEETKTLYVAYELEMSKAMASTCKPELFENGDAFKHEKKWHAYLEMNVAEWFQYVTETGQSWAGPIEKATFRVETGPFISCLVQRPVFSPGFEPPAQPEVLETWMEPITFPLKAGVLSQDISPKGGNLDSEQGTITWEYKDYKPESAICFTYEIIALPRNATECDYWVEHILGRNPQKADLMEMREIVAAFYGIVPQSESAKKFVKRQKWYHPKKELQETQLATEQQAVLKKMDVIIEAVK